MRPDPNRPGELPERLAGYQVVGVLGEGGSGTVYEASAEGRPVALKVLRADQAPTGRERQRWINEAQHLARIRHPGVVQVYATGELDDGRPYLAMEHLRGTNLAEQLARGPLELERALLLFDQLAAAVIAIHEAGLIHRDLKPENVMLVDEGRRAVLLDLGIARPAEAPPSTTTQAGYQRGTPAVMAPERFFGERATVQSDIYELAVLLFVMLTGGLPWREVLDAKQRLNPLTPSQVGLSLPPGTEAAIMRALSTEADERPRTVRAFADEVRAAGWSGATAPAHQPAPAPQEATTANARPRPARWIPRLLLAAGLLLLGGGIGAMLLTGRDEPPATPVATPVRAKVRAPSRAPVVTPVPVADAGTTVVVALDDADAGMPAAAAPDQETPAKPAAPPQPAAPVKPRPRRAAPTASSLPPPPAGATPMAACRKQFALYCTAEFKATEGAMAGALCSNMSKQLVTWEALHESARSSLEATCKANYDNAARAVEARLEFYRDNVAARP